MGRNSRLLRVCAVVLAPVGAFLVPGAVRACAPLRASLTGPPPLPSGEWVDASGGRGECCVRSLRSAAGGEGEARRCPPEGALCRVLWTAWLAERSGAWWARGERVGALRPDAELEFTLGGGMREATVSWDLAVAKMAPGDRVEIVAAAPYAFGPGAEPHVPADATLVFEVELVSWRDWAEHVQVFGADKIDDDDQDAVLQAELKRASESADADAGLLDDLKVSKDDVAASLKRADDDEAATFSEADVEAALGGLDDDGDAPVATQEALFPPGGIDGTTAEGVDWTETRDALEVDVRLPRPAPDARALSVTIASRLLEAFLDGELVAGGVLEGPVDPDDSTWALSEDRATLEVVLSKRPAPDGTSPTWARLFARAEEPA